MFLREGASDNLVGCLLSVLKKKSWEKKSELDWRFYSTRMEDKGNDSLFIGTKVFS